MSIQSLDREIEAIRAQAENARGNYEARIAEIDRDVTLSDEGRRLAREQVNASIGPRLKELRAKEDALINAEINSLELQLDSKTGNTVNDIIAFRDAQDRAERIDDPNEAERILTRAMRQGDTSLAHAIFRRGLDSNWAMVVATFTAANPELETAARDLKQLYRFRDNTFARTIQYGLLA